MNKTLWLLLAHPLLFSTYTITEADSLGWDRYADIQEKYFSLHLDFYSNACPKGNENIWLESFVKTVLRLLFNQRKG